jgi:predicted Zn-dependent protease with MMP-like domain
VETVAELAEMQMEALDWKGAAKTLEDVRGLNVAHPRLHWLLGLLLDRQGDNGKAMREFGEAVRLAPEDLFVPERLSEEEFDRQVETALTRIPHRFRVHLENAELAVEPYPSDAFAREHDVSPFLLGLFLGTPMTERGYDTADLPPRIVIFQRNLENVCRDRRELVREIGITVRHEIGHLLGMDENAIDDAGHA